MKKPVKIALLLLFSWWGYRMIKKQAFTDSNVEIDYLARTIWGEARGEGERGMHAVANVIMNRVDKGGWYGATVSEVVLKPYQFSCWNDSDVNYSKVKTVTTADSSFSLAKNIATKAYNGQLPDITGGAVNYHAKSVNPYWSKSLTKTASVGNHIFYA